MFFEGSMHKQNVVYAYHAILFRLYNRRKFGDMLPHG